MSDETPRSSNSGSTRALAVLVMLPVVYVLSLGPVACILEKSTWCRRRPRLNDAVMYVYRPLLPFVFTDKPWARPFQMYVAWWIGRGREPYVEADPFSPAVQDPNDPFAQQASDPAVQEPDSTSSQEPK